MTPFSGSFQWYRLIFPWSIPWVPEVFSRVRRGASFCRPQADTCSSEGRRHERRAWKASGTQGTWSMSKVKKKPWKVSSLKYQYDYDYEYMLWTYFRRLFLFLHWKLVYIYSRERNLRLILKEEKKIDRSVYPSEKLKPQGKSRHVFMCVRLLRVKSCTGRMRNATLRNNFDAADVHNESFESTL